MDILLHMLGVVAVQAIQAPAVQLTGLSYAMLGEI